METEKVISTRLSLKTSEWQSEKDGTYWVMVQGSECPVGNGKTLQKAKDATSAKVIEILRDHEEAARNYQRRAILTVDGQLFVVEFRNGSWGYSITGPGRSNPCGSWGGSQNTFDEQLQYARRHAESGFGGIQWEAPL